MTNGAVFYRGPSLLTADPIVGVVTGLKMSSHNEKTGPMVQAWILRSDMSPIEAVNTGADEAICGNCVHRSGSNVGRSCYVIWWLGPNQVFKALPSYPELHSVAVGRLLKGKAVRLGAYGDPAAIPASVWGHLLGAGASGWTGYTQQWRDCDSRMRNWLMASVNSVREQEEAHALGWRTFRVRGQSEPLLDCEVVCPASEEAHHSRTCVECQLCRGASRPAQSVAIIAHGQRVRWFT